MSVILYQCITLWSMCLLTEWEGRTGKYLARGHALQTEGSEVHAVWPRAKYFAVRPDLTQSISILSYDLIFYVVQKREKGKGLVNKWSVSKGARVKPMISRDHVSWWYSIFCLNERFRKEHLHRENQFVNIYDTNLSPKEQGLGQHLLGGRSISTGWLRRCRRVRCSSTQDFWHFALLEHEMRQHSCQDFLDYCGDHSAERRCCEIHHYWAVFLCRFYERSDLHILHCAGQESHDLAHWSV